MIDGNLDALRRYEDSIAKAEAKEEAFISKVYDYGIVDAYEELVEQYNTIATDEGFEDLSFEKFIAENV